MHSHAIFFADSDLNIVFPRLYVLHDLIELYRERYDAEPIPIGVIARILRQVCFGLQFLQKVGIMHRYVNTCYSHKNLNMFQRCPAGQHLFDSKWYC